MEEIKLNKPTKNIDIYNEKGEFIKKVASMIRDKKGNVIGHVFWKTNLLDKYCK